jgi:plastocyanin
MMTAHLAHTWVRRGLLTTVLIVAAIVAIQWFPAAAGTRQPGTTRELVLVVRDMTFYLQGDDTPNPTLRFAPGERVRVLLRNEESGITHNFVIGDWGVQTRELRGAGTDRVEFRVPGDGGTHRYHCTPHAAMMSGLIEVR